MTVVNVRENRRLEIVGKINVQDPDEGEKGDYKATIKR